MKKSKNKLLFLFALIAGILFFDGIVNAEEISFNNEPIVISENGDYTITGSYH